MSPVTTKIPGMCP